MAEEETKQHQFPPVFYANRQVEQLSPEQTDELLASGWWRNRSSVSTFGAVAFGTRCEACFSLRLPLAGFQWKKSLGKLLRKNGETFKVEVQPYSPGAEKKQLWQLFKKEVHRWEQVQDLDYHLFNGAAPGSFNTWELTVRQDGRLAAFSIFDRGQHSMYAVEAAYHPDFRRHSLGLYTMLLEIAHSIEQGLLYYYPGMYLPGVPMFQYKLRPGGMEFYRLLERRWVPVSELQPSDCLLEAVERRTAELARALSPSLFFAHTWYGWHFPQDTAPGPAPSQFNYLLLAGKRKGHPERPAVLVAWDALVARYVLFGTGPMAEYLLNSFPAAVHTSRQRHVFLGAFASMEELMPAIVDFLR